MAKGQYVRVYFELMDEYPKVWADEAALGTFVKLLIIADKWYPQDAPRASGRRSNAYLLLVSEGLVVESPATSGYTIRGLAAERERRSSSGRNAAAMRWGAPKAKQSKAKQTRAQSARSKQSAASADGALDPNPQPLGGGEGGIHDGSHPDCLVCAPLRV